MHVALLGAGMMGQTHAHAYKTMPKVKVAWVFDKDAERAQRLAAMLDARPTTRFDDVLEDGNVQAVDICLPTDLHRAFTEKAAAAGKHVFCEKPIALTVEDAEAMVEACEKANVTLMVGHVVRFFADYQAARRLVESGAIGEPKVIRASRTGAFPKWGSDNWFADESRSGGPIVDLAIHDIDWIRWTFGDVVRVYAKRTDRYALVTLRLTSGAICHVEASWAHPDGTPFTTKLEIAGTKGLYTTDNQSIIPLAIRRMVDGRHVYQPENPQPRDPYALELEHFFECLEKGTEPLTHGREAAKTLAICLAANESAKTGQVVTLGGASS